MFSNNPNPMFAFMKGQMPQTPFQMPFQMPQTPFQMPFPNFFQAQQQAAPSFPFNPFAAMCGMGNGEAAQEGDAAPKANPCGCPMPNPFAFFQLAQMPFPFPNPFQAGAKAEGEETAEMYKAMFPMFAMMNGQNCPWAQGKNPLEAMPQPAQIMEQLKSAFEKFSPKGAKGESSLPFGMPVKFLQLMLNLDSNPDGLSKFQKILDMIFDEYSKARTTTETEE